MGSGKSTIGPILANAIGFDFVDTDRMVEGRMGKSVQAIFHELGEEHFREIERTVVLELVAKTKLVISLGGGTLADPVNFASIHEAGILIYLKAGPEQLYRRLHQKTDRPVLRSPDGGRLSDADLQGRIEELHRLRAPVYEKADFIIETDDVRVGITVDQIVKKISRYLQS